MSQLLQTNFHSIAVPPDNFRFRRQTFVDLTAWDFDHIRIFGLLDRCRKQTPELLRQFHWSTYL